MFETIEKIARPLIAGCTVFAHPRHEVRPMRLATCKGQCREQACGPQASGAQARHLVSGTTMTAACHTTRHGS